MASRFPRIAWLLESERESRVVAVERIRGIDKVVERFVREPSEQGFALRSCNFLGDRGFTGRGVSDQPIVKASHSHQVDSPPVPERFVEISSEPGVDYGKIDYLMDGEMPVLLDSYTIPTIVRGSNKESRFPAPVYGGRRLRSTACHERTAPLVPLVLLDLPNRGRRVAYRSHDRLLQALRGLAPGVEGLQ